MKRQITDHKVAREEEILSAAREIIEKRGAEFLTMDQLAAVLPFSKGTIYNYFSSREDILTELCCACIERHRVAFSRAALFRGRARERFFAVGQASLWLREQFQEGSPLWVTEETVNQASEARRQRYREAYQGVSEILMGIVRDGIAAGDLDSKWPPELISYTAWSLRVGADELYRCGLIFRGQTREQQRKNQEIMLATSIDGFGWRPLSTEMDLEVLVQRVRAEVLDLLEL